MLISVPSFLSTVGHSSTGMVLWSSKCIIYNAFCSVQSGAIMISCLLPMLKVQCNVGCWDFFLNMSKYAQYQTNTGIFVLQLV